MTIRKPGPLPDAEYDALCRVAMAEPWARDHRLAIDAAGPAWAAAHAEEHAAEAEAGRKRFAELEAACQADRVRLGLGLV